MNIPNQLKIGGHTIQVVITKLPEDLEGDFDSATNTIRIAEDLAPSQREVILLHEVLHALNRTLDSDTIGHSFLAALAEQLYQVIADNNLLR